MAADQHQGTSTTPVTVRGVSDTSDRPGYRRVYTSSDRHEYVEFRQDDVQEEHAAEHVEGRAPADAPQELQLQGRATIYQVSVHDPDAVIDGHSLAMERMAPPTPRVTDADPRPADGPAAGSVATTVEAAPRAVPSLASVGANWRDRCEGGDAFPNNCAHYLSDAFITAGYTELQSYGARCYTPAKRPIRAREMRDWFKSKATTTSTVLQQGTGWWAIFQLDASVYWGGHVVLLDSDTWQYYGTGWYGDWSQELYQW